MLELKGDAASRRKHLIGNAGGKVAKGAEKDGFDFAKPFESIFESFLVVRVLNIKCGRWGQQKVIF